MKPLTPTEYAHVEHFVRTKQKERRTSVPEAEIERILTQMRSQDAQARAKAVREICPCRMPWEVFERLRKAAKRLQNDPDPVVAANARHIEEDARQVVYCEAQVERAQEREEESYRLRKRGKPHPREKRANLP
jgi:hypothetical protein